MTNDIIKVSTSKLFYKAVVHDKSPMKNNGCGKREHAFGNHEDSNFRVHCAKGLNIFHKAQSEPDIPVITSNRSYLEFHLDVIYGIEFTTASRHRF